ncbi:hypothetical protein DFQ28_008956 [Apophysomyces sp. BC1034]|nr:hypothetical protein DFQ30_008543 [Apophysomyces sp. BC1015]KAG0174059.1 hypothetical protein DFQ29_007610 [Apophysomyces sp. BC1021]KAG0185691.1 hypothetical protein DFQ28_008956 [Apophysomyces sp. BC1034]
MTEYKDHITLSTSNQLQQEHITQLSVHKLQEEDDDGSSRRIEPRLRRQVLVRNILINCLYQNDQQRMQEEEDWLDACFDQLDADEDEPMEECPDSKGQTFVLATFQYIPASTPQPTASHHNTPSSYVSVALHTCNLMPTPRHRSF